MNVDLKPIVDQLTETVDLVDGYKVCALIDNTDNTLHGWMVVHVSDDGTIVPYQNLKFNTIKELIEYYKKDKFS